MDWLDLLAVQGTLKSLLQHHSLKTSILRHAGFFTAQLSHPYMTTGKTIALTRQTFVGKTKVGHNFLEYQSGLPFPSPGDFPEPAILPCRQTLYPLSHQGSFIIQHEEPKKVKRRWHPTNLEKPCPSLRRTCLLSISLTPLPFVFAV